MKGRTSIVTCSEAIQKIVRRESCPHVIDCDAPVTKQFFSRICYSAGYLKCHYFAKRVGELKAPMTWLQRFAIAEEKQITRMKGAETAQADMENTVP